VKEITESAFDRMLADMPKTKSLGEGIYAVEPKSVLAYRYASDKYDAYTRVTGDSLKSAKFTVRFEVGNDVTHFLSKAPRPLAKESSRWGTYRVSLREGEELLLAVAT